MSIEQTRALLLVLSLGLGVAAVAFWVGGDTADPAYLAWLWPFTFAGAALSCLVFAAAIHSATWWQISKVFVVMSVLGRVAGIAAKLMADSVNSPANAVGAMAVYACATLAFWRLWAVDLRYWSRRSELERS